jgi:membrane-bound metal-dependent hydrolase YbcI (DUF457 family)
MADFNTHITVAAASSGILSSLCLGAELVNPTQMLILWGAGTLGGILPDVDSDHSTAIKTVFTLFALMCASIAAFSQAGAFSIVELWLLWGGVYLIVRYLVMTIFKDFTVHRGIYHSLLAGVFFWLIFACLMHYLFKLPALFSWVVGLFIFFGFIVHLLLDEIYGVDFTRKRLKRSFGSAFKLVDARNPVASVLMALAIGVLALLAPPPHGFIEVMTDKNTYQRIAVNLLPETPDWFDNLRSAWKVIATPPEEVEDGEEA